MEMLDLTTQVQEWRRKAKEGTLTQEEMRQAISMMREGRVSAVATSTKARAKKAAPAKVDSEGMLDELDLI